MVSQLRRVFLHPGVWLTLLFLMSSLLARLASDTRWSNTVLLIGLGSGLGWSVTWLFTRQTLTKPLTQMIADVETLVVKDSLALTNALAALAQGNLTAHAALDSQFVPLKGSLEIRQLAKVFNTVIAQLQGSAKEFNTVTSEPSQRLFYVGSDFISKDVVVAR